MFLDLVAAIARHKLSAKTQVSLADDFKFTLHVSFRDANSAIGLELLQSTAQACPEHFALDLQFSPSRWDLEIVQAGLKAH